MLVETTAGKSCRIFLRHSVECVKNVIKFWQNLQTSLAHSAPTSLQVLTPARLILVQIVVLHVCILGLCTIQAMAKSSTKQKTQKYKVWYFSQTYLPTLCCRRRNDTKQISVDYWTNITKIYISITQIWCNLTQYNLYKVFTNSTTSHFLKFRCWLDSNPGLRHTTQRCNIEAVPLPNLWIMP